MMTKILILYLLALLPVFGGELHLLLPEKIYAVPGIETNVYFDNIVLTPNPANYVFDVDCKRGRNDAKRWRFTPDSKDAGEFDWEICISDGFNIVAQGKTKLVITPENAEDEREISILMVGDSLTAAGLYPARLGALMPQLKMIGSRKSGGAVHEGYGGWHWESFLTQVQDKNKPRKSSNATSPFLFEKGGRHEPDFQQYLNKFNGGKAPDFITVMLGINDIFGATDDDVEVRIAAILENAERLIAVFRAAAPKAVIGVGFPTPGAASQDAFGSNYRCGQTRWQFKKNQHRLCLAMLRKFGDSVSLIPTFVNLDCENNFPVQSEKINAHNEQEIVRQSNGVHPAPSGYNQIGDTFYCWLKNQLKEK